MHISRAWCHECREATREERTAHNFAELWVGEHTHGALRTMKHFGFRWACWRIQHLIQHLKDGGRKVRWSGPASATRVLKDIQRELRPCLKKRSGVKNRNDNERRSFKPENLYKPIPKVA